MNALCYGAKLMIPGLLRYENGAAGVHALMWQLIELGVPVGRSATCRVGRSSGAFALQALSWTRKWC